MASASARMAYAASQTKVVYMKRFNKTEFPIFILLCVLCFQSQPFRFLFYLTAADVKCHVATVKDFPVFHHKADYILISFGIIKSILITLKIE